ncbi:hypothetical protein ACWDG9_36330 [Streptomyces sp. NPDC001073]
MSAALVAFSVLAAAGCSSGGGDVAQKPSTPTGASATASVSASDTQDRKAVIAAYQGMNNEQVKAYARSSLDGSNITKYATGAALRDTKDTVFVNLQNGIVVKGEPKVTVTEDDVAFNAAGTRATLTVCFDLNSWESVDKETGKSVTPPNQVKRYTTVAHLQEQDSRWLVTDEKADKTKSC